MPFMPSLQPGRTPYSQIRAVRFSPQAVPADKAVEIDGARFWPRFTARLIDLSINSIVALCAGLAIAVGSGRFSFANIGSVTALFGKLTAAEVFSNWNLVSALLGSIVYFTICESVHGSTVGKSMLSLVVVQEDGLPCRLDSALVRSVAILLDGFFFGMVGYYAMANKFRQQRYGDKWADTIVCFRDRVPRRNLRGGGRLIIGVFLGIFVEVAVLVIGASLKLLF